MPKGIYFHKQRTEEDKKNRSKSAKEKGMGKWMTQVWAEGRASPNSLNAITKGNRDYLIGKPLSEKHRNKLSEARNKGIKEGRIIPWNKGIKNPYFISEEHRRKISESNKGKKRTPEMIEKYRECNKGKKLSELTRKKISANQQEIPLEKWEKFISREPYDQKWDNQFKREIRKRDNQICMMCGIHREKLNNPLHIHHINYDKKLSIPENCLSLCNSCHTKTNHNRGHWINFFQSLLHERYNYDYTKLNEPIFELVGIENGINGFS